MSGLAPPPLLWSSVCGQSELLTEQGEDTACRPDDQTQSRGSSTLQQVGGRDENTGADHCADD